MLSIIVAQNGAGTAALQRTLEAVQSTGMSNILLITEQGEAISDGGIPTIMSAPGELAAAIQKALASTSSKQSLKSETIVLIDARLAPSNHELQSAIGAMSRAKDSQLQFVPLRRGGTFISLANLTAEGSVGLLSSNPEWPLMILAGARESFEGGESLQSESFTEYAAQILMRAIGRGNAVSAAGSSIEAPRSMATPGSLRMSGQAMARTMQTLVNSCNIEDLFPFHSWEMYQEESAAAAYHALAALFVRFGDIESAQECIRLSDQFEDSPRSLALKALVARTKGETLGAVANMVASLQQYEMRKREDAKHYVQFSPRNIEKISDNLQSGLAALNRADNETALQHFSEAVFSFDSFYSEAGIATLKQ